MKISTQLVNHSEALPELLEKIANIKMLRWKYPLENQLQWINDNLKSTDIHLLVYLYDNLIAYTNFVDIEVIINDIPVQFKGIGNVCTLESGRGYGEVLMKGINHSIFQNNWYGILLCKDNLVKYYSKYNWKLVNSDNISTEFLKNTNTFIYNFDLEIIELKYIDRNF